AGTCRRRCATAVACVCAAAGACVCAAAGARVCAAAGACVCAAAGACAGVTAGACACVRACVCVLTLRRRFGQLDPLDVVKLTPYVDADWKPPPHSLKRRQPAHFGDSNNGAPAVGSRLDSPFCDESTRPSRIGPIDRISYVVAREVPPDGAGVAVTRRWRRRRCHALTVPALPSRPDGADLALTPRRCRPGAHAPTVPTWRSRPDGADLALTPRRCRPGAHAPTVPAGAQARLPTP